jgi:hypothetical protein
VTVRAEIARPLIDDIRDGSLVLAWCPDERWLKASRYTFLVKLGCWFMPRR